MANERITESIVRDILHDNGYYNNINITIEEQLSNLPKINKLLKHASKDGNGKGYPDFIITFSDNRSDQVILIECKAQISQHHSEDGQHYKDYAVDGVLLYADYLKSNFDVIAIAVSGQTKKEIKKSTFLWLKNNYQFKKIKDDLILDPKRLEKTIEEQKKPINEKELIVEAIKFNKKLHNYGIKVEERCIVISSILLALQKKSFIKSYKEYKNTENEGLMKNILYACEEVLKEKKLSNEKIKIIIHEYSKYKNNLKLISPFMLDKDTKQNKPNTLLKDLITDISDAILHHITNNTFDILGKFYTQFIKYAGSEQSLGLVLTPTHITDLFCDLVELGKKDIVYDPCCGTGGFLVSAMNAMLNDAKDDKKEQTKIKENNLIGVELSTEMFSHACSNMMMRGDGRSQIEHGDCFEKEKEIKKLRPNISFLNPPYVKNEVDRQLEFVEHSLECLVKNGTCVAICQMSTTTNTDNKVLTIKERLLKKHTLKAVLSMPDELFYPVSVPTVILIFEAHQPHNSDLKTFFGYFKDDGFVKSKDKGRIDINNKWPEIKKNWLKTYKNKENIDKFSINKEITYKDEWLAEAYMETDYTKLQEQDFIQKIKDFVAFQFLNED